MSILTLKIQVCGNPDKGQDPSKPPFGVPGTTTLRAATFPRIRIMMEEFQSRHDLGGGNWKEATLYEDDKKVGRVSWNGRVWDENDKEILL